MILPVLMSLAQLAPAVIGLFDSDDESTTSKAARLVSSTARSVTGAADDGGALAALQADPAALTEYRTAMNGHAAEMYRSETERLKAVNETIRAEVASADPYVRRMRPTMGYALILAWTATVMAIVYAIVATPAEAPAVITAVSQLGMIWSVALSVLGLYVWKRSEDKKPPQTGALSQLASGLAARLGGR